MLHTTHAGSKNMAERHHTFASRLHEPCPPAGPTGPPGIEGDPGLELVIERLFTPEECGRINLIFDEIQQTQGGKFRDPSGELVNDPRGAADRCILSRDDRTAPIYDHMTGWFQKVNASFYKEHLYETGTHIIQRRMIGTGFGCSWHTDVNGWQTRNGTLSKISCCILLNERSAFEGGALCVENQEIDIPGIGVGCFFPSWANHSVAEVTRGTRVSMTAYIRGPMWEPHER